MNDFKYNFTVREKGSGWQLILSYKDGGAWKQKTRSGFPRKRDALAAREELLNMVKKDAHTDKTMSKITLLEFANLYLKNRPDLTYGSRLSYRLRIESLPTLKSCAVKNITYTMIANEIAGLNMARTTTDAIVIVLKMLLNAAVDYRIIAETPFPKKLPVAKVKKEKRLRVLSREEIDRIISRPPQKDMDILLIIMACTGMRIGEALGLTWQDIDFRRMEIRINKQWGLVGPNKNGFKPVKNALGNRTVPMSSILARRLTEYRDLGIFYMDGRLTRQNFSSPIRARLRKLTGAEHSAHDFRHTFATNMLASGADVATVAALLGDTIQTVTTVYLHYSEDLRKAAAAKVDRLYS